jgi:hypothetical protein
MSSSCFGLIMPALCRVVSNNTCLVLIMRNALGASTHLE